MYPLGAGGRSNQRPEWQVEWCLRCGCRMAHRLVHVCGLVNFLAMIRRAPEGYSSRAQLTW